MRLTLASLAVVAACGDDLKSSLRPDAPPVDHDAAPDAPPDANPYVPPTPFAIPISPAGPDQLQSVAAGPDGTFYAAGFSAAAVGGARNVIVVKLTATGLDTTFGGGDGIATTTTLFSGGSDEAHDWSNATYCTRWRDPRLTDAVKAGSLPVQLVAGVPDRDQARARRRAEAVAQKIRDEVGPRAVVEFSLRAAGDASVGVLFAPGAYGAEWAP
jgi:hypothetical protein